jgi:DNA-directed RNA polymerase specialized sigma24 family protein
MRDSVVALAQRYDGAVAVKCRSSTSAATGSSWLLGVVPVNHAGYARRCPLHASAAHALLAGLMRNDEDAEHVVQEASLRAFRYFRTFNGGSGAEPGSSESFVTRVMAGAATTAMS